MFLLGTIINTAAIVVGGLIGLLFGKLLKDRHRQTLQHACGLSVLFIAIAGAMEGMLSIADGGIVSGGSLLVVVCMVVGGLIGELINFDGLTIRFGNFLKRKTNNANDAGFVNGFVTASLTVCVGAMAIVGAIEDGIYGDISILVTKSVLDFIIVMALAGSYGVGAIFSALPVFVVQGLFTVLARVIKPVLTDQAMVYLSLIGSIIIFGVGLNLLRNNKIRVANFIPALVVAVAAALLGF